LKTHTTTWLDQPITIRTEGIASRSDGAVWLDMGGTIVLATTVIEQKKIEPLDFVPLSVHYFEKAYAVNKIPGGFGKRETKPQDHEVRTARLIDRAIRPLMPDGLCHEVQIIITVLAYNPEVDIIIPSFLAAFLSLRLSGLPLKTSENMCGVAVGQLFFAVTPTKIVMMDGEGPETPHAVIYAAAKQAIEIGAPIFTLMDKITAKQKKTAVTLYTPDPLCYKAFHNFQPEFEKIISVKKKKERTQKLYALRQKIMETLKKEFSEFEIKKTFEIILSESMMHQLTTTKMRIDGRQFDEIRPIQIEIGVLPKAHGSVLFTRGDTQVLGVLTVAGGDKKQYIDDLKGHAEHLIFHYNFPPFCVGDTDRIGAPSRREIGHGHIGFRAIKNVLPYNPNYTYRIVSEVLSCNGSSSMASVCAASLALQMAGIETNNLVAGIGLGYVRAAGKDLILTDILGDEDHMGLMDLKLAGTVKGITAIQMDVKVPGISLTVLSKALTQGRKALTAILKIMKQTTTQTLLAADVSASVPKIETLEINRDAVYATIGKGGYHIKTLITEYPVKIDTRDSGLVTITGKEWKDVYAVKKIIRQLTDPMKKGDEFLCEITHAAPKKVQVRLNRYIKGYVKFKSKEEQEVFLTKNPINTKIALKYAGIDRFGDVILGA
jgi:polyribonucleotide nucleotidyltransferase